MKRRSLYFGVDPDKPPDAENTEEPASESSLEETLNVIECMNFNRANSDEPAPACPHPEKSLLAMIVGSALMDLSRSQYAAEAKRWIFSESRTFPSFLSIMEALEKEWAVKRIRLIAWQLWLEHEQQKEGKSGGAGTSSLPNREWLSSEEESAVQRCREWRGRRYSVSQAKEVSPGVKKDRAA